MTFQKQKINRPVALVILDGWGYAPRTEGDASAIAHTPYYDEIPAEITGVGAADGGAVPLRRFRAVLLMFRFCSGALVGDPR